MNKSLFAEFIEFLLITKKWWLAPIILTLLILSVLIIFGSASPLSPFIYGMI